MVSEYHHRKILESLTAELHEAGLERDARQIHTQVMVEHESVRPKLMRRLIAHVRTVRNAAAARAGFVLEATAELVLYVDRHPDQMRALFDKPAEQAAEQAATSLTEVATLELARRKLMNDFGIGDSDDEAATTRIIEVIDTRLRQATTMLSLHGAAAGGMALEAFKEKVMMPMLREVSDGIENLDEGIRDQIQGILDEQG